DIVMRSKRIPAKQALEWGIVTDCVPDKDLETVTDKLVDELRTFSPIAQRTAKKLLNDTEDSTLAIAIELEGHCYSRLRQSDDFKEGVEAFNAKRPPKFAGRRSTYDTTTTGGHLKMSVAEVQESTVIATADRRQAMNAMIASLLGWSLD